MADGAGKEGAIIIKKIKKGGHGFHGGAWKVAYADFVTAMMAFFIVMWILASSEEVKKQVEAYFQDPGAFSFVTGKRTVPLNIEMVPEKGKGEGGGKKEEPQPKREWPWSFDQKKDTSTAFQKAVADSVVAAERVRSLGKTLKEVLKEMVSKQPDLEEILSSIKIEITDQGLRIELVEKSDDFFFEIGSAQLKPRAVEILRRLAREIGKMPNYVELEGHTDSRGYSGMGYTNFELSSDRANAARRVLDRFGFWSGQITKVTGYADKMLSNPANPFDFTNRRVSIVVRQLSSRELMGQVP